ncbi:MAG: OmpA family protein [Bryobacterales bacterium]|nr:OmpA family protein [Bryobacterales bacterium]
MLEINRNQTVLLAGLVLLALSGLGCATKKYVRQQIDPVTGRVTSVEQATAKNASSINELENNVSQATEKAMGADRKAEQAAQSAQEANQLAMNAKNRADEVGANADRRFSDVDRSIQNIDNYQQISAETILFGFDKSTLTTDSKAKLDQLIHNLQNQNRYVIEVEGFTDRTGSPAYNLTLSAKRADAVVRYLTLEHSVPLRRIHVLGAGEAEHNPHMRAAEARKMARHVAVKVYGPVVAPASGEAVSSGSADRSMPRSQASSSGAGQIPRQ